MLINLTFTILGNTSFHLERLSISLKCNAITEQIYLLSNFMKHCVTNDCAVVCVSVCVYLCKGERTRNKKGNEEQEAKTAEIPDPAWLWILALKVFHYNIFTVSWSVQISANVWTVPKVPWCVAKLEQHHHLILCLVLGCSVEQAIISWHYRCHSLFLQSM